MRPSYRTLPWPNSSERAPAGDVARVNAAARRTILASSGTPSSMTNVMGVSSDRSHRITRALAPRRRPVSSSRDGAVPSGDALILDDFDGEPAAVLPERVEVASDSASAAARVPGHARERPQYVPRCASRLGEIGCRWRSACTTPAPVVALARRRAVDAATSAPLIRTTRRPACTSSFKRWSRRPAAARAEIRVEHPSRRERRWRARAIRTRGSSFSRAEARNAARGKRNGELRRRLPPLFPIGAAGAARHRAAHSPTTRGRARSARLRRLRVLRRPVRRAVASDWHARHAESLWSNGWHDSHKRRSRSAWRKLPGWALAGEAIERHVFASRLSPPPIAFVARSAAIADAADHHPDILVRYDRVTSRSRTHRRAGSRARLRARGR